MPERAARKPAHLPIDPNWSNRSEARSLSAFFHPRATLQTFGSPSCPSDPPSQAAVEPSASALESAPPRSLRPPGRTSFRAPYKIDSRLKKCHKPYQLLLTPT